MAIGLDGYGIAETRLYPEGGHVFEISAYLLKDQSLNKSDRN
jgi:hypothetical protein